MSDLFNRLQEYGGPGLAVCFLLYVCRELWLDVKAQRDARLAEAKETTRLLLELAERQKNSSKNPRE